MFYDLTEHDLMDDAIECTRVWSPLFFFALEASAVDLPDSRCCMCSRQVRSEFWNGAAVAPRPFPCHGRNPQNHRHDEPGRERLDSVGEAADNTLQ